MYKCIKYMNLFKCICGICFLKALFKYNLHTIKFIQCNVFIQQLLIICGVMAYHRIPVLEHLCYPCIHTDSL